MLEELSQRIAAHLSRETGAPATVHDVRPLPGGACQELFRVDVTLAAGPLEGQRRFVLRSDARESLPGSLDRDAEGQVINAAVAAGVPTPAARWAVKGLARPEAHAYFLDWVEGVAIGRRVVSHPSLAKAREVLPRQLAQALAAAHRVTPAQSPELPLPDRDVDPVDSALGALRATLDRLPEPHPALELAFRWLGENRPPLAKPTLVHGDFRTGNFMVAERGLVAVLDWEFAHWGDPLEDLGWLCVRDWRFGNVDRPAGGFARRHDFYALYAEASGRTVDAAAVHFWEVLGNVRWGGGAVLQGQRFLHGGSRDLEHLAIPRRACEMEFEALRLIETGPPKI
jgi:aminoglycoside phosphotransferase (APT) family kinase protein